MTPTDDRIVERMRAAAAQIPVEPKLAAIIRAGRAASPQDPAGTPEESEVILECAFEERLHHRSWVLRGLVAACVVVIVAGLALATRQGQGGVDAASPAGIEPPAGIPAGAPAPGSVAPIVEMPPDWFGRPMPARRDAGMRTGRWVYTAIGLDAGDGTVVSPIVIAATDGSLGSLAEADTVMIGGRMLRRHQIGDWQTLATTQSPMVVVSGQVDEQLLAEVLADVRPVFLPEGISLSLDRLPPGYSELVPPQLLAEDVPDRRSIANISGDTAIHEESDWVQPELAAAAAGVDYHSVEIDGLTGWTGRTVSNPFGPVSFLTWSPAPGVVFSIVTANLDHSTADLIELAEATHVLSSEQWDEVLSAP